MRPQSARAVSSAVLLYACVAAQAAPPRAVEVPSRPGVNVRVLYMAPDKPKAAAILFAGGPGDFQVAPDGAVLRQKGNFLVRSRELFIEQGIAVAVLSPPSDRQNLVDFRNAREHVEDVRAVIAWLRRETGVPVWLIGTSRGTQSAGYIATQLARGEGGADGLVLTSSVLASHRNLQEPPIQAMAVERIAVPVLVVHHREDHCRVCPFSGTRELMSKLTAAPRKELIAVEGGADEGDPCEPFAHHGYNGIERDVVKRIAGWIVSP
jgi:pimeloyl-ACP methyl ester carboxylesterase